MKFHDGFMVLALGVALAGSSDAATILDVAGPSDGALIFGPATAGAPGVAAGFTLDTKITEASITLPFNCFSGCQAQFYLSTGLIGQSATLLDWLAVTDVD